ncbi:MAG: deoxyribodipyrimidine photo-lyase [Gammaproteobacteria bacterium]|nr:deoxyribodipyrimidine photo-lyase [Gammaproteobacteria bacterium]
MAKSYKTAVFVFRRDLRLDDNTGLRKAFALAERVLPCFIFDPRQQGDQNDYFTAHGFQFLLESLEDLERQLKAAGGALYRFAGLPHEIVERLIEQCGAEAVMVNRDYTPFSRLRDGELQALCARRHVFFGQYPDVSLNEPGRTVTEAGTPFRVFTPYYRRARQFDVPSPQSLKAGDFHKGPIEFARGKTLYDELLKERNAGAHVRGGRDSGVAILRRLADFNDYGHSHDAVAQAGTTSLSAHHKFGTVSIREVYHALKKELAAASEEIIRQLYWRDFFTQLAFFNPWVFGKSLKTRFDDMRWDNDENHFNAWCEGRTGFPMVDAGMRQLNETGWMHNRARLVTGSFLTKNLLIDWRWGERYFARRLVDYDPCVNNGNWQWIASVGVDTRPIRILNPWTQQQKFDSQAEYVKRWVPALRGLTPEAIHRLHDSRPPGLNDYPSPMMDHTQQFHAARERYEQAGYGQTG